MQVERERIAELDVLRFAAAAGVVLFHATFWPAQRTFLTEVFTFGFMGVPLFFMISGFVILMTAEHRGGIAFINSRIARLYPTFWICVLLSSAALALLGDGPPSLATLAANLTMLPRMLFNERYIDPVYWTLAVEMKFYALVWLLIVTRQMKRVELFLVLWLCVVIIASFIEVPHWLEVVTFPSWASLFITGCYFYLIRSRGPTLARSVGIATSVLVSMYWVLRYQQNYTSSEALLTQAIVLGLILFFTVVFFFVARRKWQLPRSPLWLWLGCLTYPLYLTHATAGRLVWQSLPGPEWTRVWIVLGLVLLVSALLAAVVERRLCGRFNRFLDRLTQQALDRSGMRRRPQDPVAPVAGRAE